MSASLEKTPAISVLLPVYNGADEIHETVGYILNQTFTDFELLLLDDGSTDNTWEIIQDIASKDDRIRTFRNVENKGVVESTITLTNAAKGEILVKEDCGDWSAPERYEIQYKTLQDNPSAVACLSDYWLLEVDGTPVGIRKMPPTAEALKARVKISNVTAHPTFAMRKNAFEKVGGYDSNIPCSLDYDILLKLMELGTVIPINKALVACKFNPTGITFRNLRKQAACVTLIKSYRYGENAPASMDFEPLSIAESEAAYHRTVGKIHLAKGKTKEARKHLKLAANFNTDGELKKLLMLSYIPKGAIQFLRQISGRNHPEETQPPFFEGRPYRA